MFKFDSEKWDDYQRGDKISLIDYLVYSLFEMVFLGIKWGVVIGIVYLFIVFLNKLFLNQIFSSLTPDEINQLAKILGHIK